MKNTLILLFLIISYSCKNQHTQEKNKLMINNYEKLEKEYIKQSSLKKKVYMSDTNVKDFVNILKANTTDKDTLDFVITVGQTNSNWISNNDLDFLISKINSKEKANCINRRISSIIPNSKNITLGHQIISIIESYRNNEPYPNDVCICKSYSQYKVDEIVAWWKNKKTKENISIEKQNVASTIALNFINAYAKYCDDFNSELSVFEWIDQQKVTQQFKQTYKTIITEAEKEDPELGLGFDPIFDAQNYPDNGFELAKSVEKPNFIMVKGKELPDYKLKIKMKPVKNRWLVDGVGIINMTKEEQLKRY
ncbi:hypothetical protein [uncultured Tenacibaculum sp.]|uniref:hypothetical protein n=1 Tax=uncultured Tenacibaculum sp. TaxID=174713 RepID=UPI002633E929|nr:hypothetical protein [uncultured Tenacibaculum sp.]